MNRSDVEAITATFTTDKVNHNLQVTLPGAVVEFLILWAGAGVSESPDEAPDRWLEVIREEVDGQVLRQIGLPLGTVRHHVDNPLDHGGVWDAQGRSLIGGPDLSGSPAEHVMTDQPSGRVTCSCGANSQRFGTVAGQRAWKSAHKRGR